MKIDETPRAVLLDWDDTLVDNWASIHAAMNTVLAAMGRAAWTLEQTRAESHRSLRNSFPELFGERWQEARDVFYSAFAADHLRLLKARPGAESLITRLSGRGIFMAVVSNKTGDFLREEAAHLGWSQHFSAIVGATDAPEDKPAPAPVRMALAKSGIAPGPGVWFVGDGRVDMECAYRSSCRAVLIRESTAEAKEFGPHPPHWHLRSLADLEALIFGA